MVKVKEPKKVKKIVKKAAPKKAVKVKVAKPKEIKKAKVITAEIKKEEKVSSEKKGSDNLPTGKAGGKYFYALGRRKTSIAQVRIYPASSKGEFKVNGKDLVQYLTIKRFQTAALSPLVRLGLEEKFDVSVKVFGGGINGQADAIKLGIARALVVFDESLRKALKDSGFLTRDSRKVERKKPGLKKARKSPQWAKR
jgi:small subunit ribosomal protein S9